MDELSHNDILQEWIRLDPIGEQRVSIILQFLLFRNPRLSEGTFIKLSSLGNYALDT